MLVKAFAASQDGAMARDADKERRLAEALRANLRRRKAPDRVVEDRPPPPPPPSD